MFAKTLTLAVVAASTSAIKIKAVPDWCNEPMLGMPTDVEWTEEMFEEFGRLSSRCSGMRNPPRSGISHDMVW